MLKIGDFSKLAQVTVRTLRFYDELNLLRPEVVDGTSGYRYYTVEQLPRLYRILALKDLGLELEQIPQFLDADIRTEELRDRLLAQEAELERRIRDDQERLQRVRSRLDLLTQDASSVLIDINLKALSAQPILGNRMLVPGVADIPFASNHLFTELYTWLKQQRIPHQTTQAILYHTDEYVEQDFDLEVAVFLPELPAVLPPLPHDAIRFFTLPAVPLMATLIHQGELKTIGHSAYQLVRWCSQQGYRFPQDGMALREVHHFPPVNPPQRLPLQGIVELQLPVIKPDSSIS